MTTEEKQAPAKQAFVFLWSLTSKRPMKSDKSARQRGFASIYDIMSVSSPNVGHEAQIHHTAKATILTEECLPWNEI